MGIFCQASLLRPFVFPSWRKGFFLRGWTSVRFARVSLRKRLKLDVQLVGLLQKHVRRKSARRKVTALASREWKSEHPNRLRQLKNLGLNGDEIVDAEDDGVSMSGGPSKEVKSQGQTAQNKSVTLQQPRSSRVAKQTLGEAPEVAKQAEAASRLEVEEQLSALSSESLSHASAAFPNWMMGLIYNEMQKRGIESFNNSELSRLIYNIATRVSWTRMTQKSRLCLDFTPLMKEAERRAEELSRQELLAVVEAGKCARAILPASKLVSRFVKVWTNSVDEAEEAELLSLISVASDLRQNHTEIDGMLPLLKKAYLNDLDVISRRIAVEILFEICKSEQLTCDPDLLEAVDKEFAHRNYISTFSPLEFSITAHAYFLAGYRKSRIDFTSALVSPKVCVEKKGKTAFLYMLQYALFTNAVRESHLREISRHFVHHLTSSQMNAHNIALSAHILALNVELRGQLPASVLRVLGQNISRFMAQFSSQELPPVLECLLVCDIPFPNLVQIALRRSEECIQPYSHLETVISLVNAVSCLEHIPWNHVNRVLLFAAASRSLHQEELKFCFERIGKLCESLAFLGVDVPQWTADVLCYVKSNWKSLLVKKTESFLRTMRALANLSIPVVSVVEQISTSFEEGIDSDLLWSHVQTHRVLLSLIYLSARSNLPNKLLSRLLDMTAHDMPVLSAEDSYQLLQINALTESKNLDEKTILSLIELCEPPQLSKLDASYYDQLEEFLGGPEMVKRNTRFGNGLYANFSLLIGRNGQPREWLFAGDESVKSMKRLRLRQLQVVVIRVLGRKDFLLFSNTASADKRQLKLCAAIEKLAFEASRFKVLDLYVGDWLQADCQVDWVKDQLENAFQ